MIWRVGNICLVLGICVLHAASARGEQFCEKVNDQRVPRAERKLSLLKGVLDYRLRCSGITCSFSLLGRARHYQSAPLERMELCFGGLVGPESTNGVEACGGKRYFLSIRIRSEDSSNTDSIEIWYFKERRYRNPNCFGDESEPQIIYENNRVIDPEVIFTNNAFIRIYRDVPRQ